MASSYNRKSDSSASSSSHRASGAGKRTSVSAGAARKSARKDTGKTQRDASAKSSAGRRPRGSMDDAALVAAASAAMSGASRMSSSAVGADTGVSNAPAAAGSSSAPKTSSGSVTVVGRRPRSDARSTRVGSVRSAAGEPVSSVHRERTATGAAASGERTHASSRTRRSEDARRVDGAGTGAEKRNSRSSRRASVAGEKDASGSSRRKSHREDSPAEKATEDSLHRHSLRAGKSADDKANSKKRKSIRDKASKKKDAAPAGTDDLSMSDSARRRRNRDVDEVAAEGGRRVGDIRASRAAERAARARKRYLSYVIKLAAVVATVLVVVFGSIFIYRSNLLAITTVTVSGAEHLTDQEVTQLAAVPDDSTLLRLDTAGICGRLEEHPWVQRAQISRQFPNSIKIQITERTPSAVVKISKKSIWVISTDGAWLSSATKDDWKNYRRIVDADATMSAPVAGSECTNEGVLNALKIYDGVSSKLAEQISSISAESAVKTSLTLKGGVTVAFGEAEDLELKEADIFALLDKYSGTVSYINVRVPDRPTYRTAKG